MCGGEREGGERVRERRRCDGRFLIQPVRPLSFPPISRVYAARCTSADGRANFGLDQNNERKKGTRHFLHTAHTAAAHREKREEGRGKREEKEKKRRKKKRKKEKRDVCTLFEQRRQRGGVSPYQRVGKRSTAEGIVGNVRLALRLAFSIHGQPSPRPRPLIP